MRENLEIIIIAITIMITTYNVNSITEINDTKRIIIRDLHNTEYDIKKCNDLYTLPDIKDIITISNTNNEKECKIGMIYSFYSDTITLN